MALRIGVQGDSRGNFNIFEGDCIGNCFKKEVNYKQVSNSEWLKRWSCLNLQT
jgi:hypothetical protein